MVKLLKVLEPVKVPAPIPLPVMDELLNVSPRPANVFAVEDVSLSTMVDVLSVSVRPVVVAVVQTVPVPLSVHVPVPMEMARVFELEEEKFATETSYVTALSVP